MSASEKPRAITVRDIRQKKGREPIVCITAYDVLFAKLVDQAGVDLILVGDSVGNVVAGQPTTLAVTMEQMIYHGAAVVRGVSRAMVVVDMPFLSYQIDAPHAIENAGRILRETGAQAVKLEGGGKRIAPIVAALVECGVPVMGHLGFTPQSVNTLGGARVQGRGDDDEARLMEEARRLEDAGVFAIVLELVPATLARRISEQVSVPTIGIGAGVGCDGQVLVLPDMLGINEGFVPRFLKHYASLAGTVRDAVQSYANDVRARRYPDDEHSF